MQDLKQSIQKTRINKAEIEPENKRDIKQEFFLY